MDLSLLFLFFLILCSAFCAMTETSLFSLSPMKVQSYRLSKNPKKLQIAALLKKPRELLVTIFLLNTLVNILIQNTMSSMAGPEGTLAEKVLAPFLVTLFFGEIIPKNIGMLKNETLAPLVSKPISVFGNFIKPLRKLLISITDPISSYMFFFLKKEKSISKDELKHALNTSIDHGILSHGQSRLIWGYLTLQDTLAKEVCLHKKDVRTYDIKEPLTKLTHLFLEEQLLRVPVCDGDIDSVLGFLSATTFLTHRKEIEEKGALRSTLKKPLFVPESIFAKNLFKKFNEEKEEVALLVDEYGIVEGLITQEDLVEIVIGNIASAKDREPLYTLSGKDEIIASAEMELKELSDFFSIPLKSRFGSKTVGGYLIEELGTIPKAGTGFAVKPLFFQVLAAEPHCIKRLYIRKLKEGGA